MIHLNQNKYVQDLVHKVGLNSTNPYGTPMVSGKALSKHVGTPLVDPTYTIKA